MVMMSLNCAKDSSHAAGTQRYYTLLIIGSSTKALLEVLVPCELTWLL
jgi:hypothetical protein